MKEGWEYKKLGEVADVAAGQGAPQGDSNYCSDGIPFIKAGNLESLINGMSEHKVQNVSDVVAKSHRLKLYKAGSVLFAKSGMSCMKGWVYTLKHDCYVVSHLAIITPHKQKIESRYLNYYFQFYKPNTLVKDAAYPSISLKDIENMPLLTPPLSEQQHIVEELDLLSSIIEKKKAQLKELDNLAQSIFYEMFGDPTKTSKGWKVKKMGDVCILKSGNSDANKSASGDLPYVKVGDMNLEGNETYIVLSSTYVDRVANARNIFPIGTIIFPKRGGAILTNKKRLTKTDICCDLNVMGVIPNTDIVIPLYVYYYFLRIDFSVFANTGSTIPQINNYDIAPMNIVLPPMDVQNQFASKIEAVEHQKELTKQSIKEVETLFNSRMDYYFN